MKVSLKQIGIVLAGSVGALALGWLSGRHELLAIAAAIAMLIAVPLLMRPQRIVGLILLLVVVGQFGRIPPGSASGAFLAIDFVVGALFGIWLMWVIIKRTSLNLSPAHLVWLAFLSVAAITLVFGPFALSRLDLLQNGFYLVRLVSYSSMIWIIPALFRTEKDLTKLVRWLIAAGMGVVILGFVQLYVLPDIGVLARFGWDPHVGRLVSSFLDPNYLGGYFAILLAILLAWQIQTKRFPWLEVLLVLVASVLTFSRSGYIAVAVVALYFGLRFSWKLVLLGIICVVPLSLTIPRVRERVEGGFSVDKTSRDRIDSWQIAIAVADQYRVTGVGYNSYQNAQEEMGAIKAGSTSKAAAGSDSSLLNVLATTGIIGICLFLASVALVLKRCLTVVRSGRTGPQAAMALALLVLAPALFIHAFFVNAYFYPFIMITLAIMVGIVYAGDDEVA